MTSEYEQFLRFFDEGAYDGCTIAQKVEVYYQHRPAKPAGFTLELLLELHPELKDPEEDDESERRD